MEITDELINGLEINPVEIVKNISTELNISLSQVVPTVTLLKEGNTVPFISRYRKEATAPLDEV